MDEKTTSHIIGETLTKLHFELLGYFVYTNSSGKSEFDLVLSKEGFLYSVEVKTVSVEKESTKGKYFEAQLKSVRSNTSNNTIKHFDPTFIDYLVIVNIAHNTLIVYNPKEIEARSSLRIYTNNFYIPGKLAESA